MAGKILDINKSSSYVVDSHQEYEEGNSLEAKFVKGEYQKRPILFS